MNKNAIAKTKEEYVAYVWDDDAGKYIWLTGTQSSTLDASKKAFEKSRAEWECYRKNLDYNNVQFRHRTVTYTEWEVVG